jgi:[protein-PII] uridylyltransferase
MTTPAETEPLPPRIATALPADDDLHERAKTELINRRRETTSRAEQLELYRSFIRAENQRIRNFHHAGGGGIEVARRRSRLIDEVLDDLFEAALEASDKIDAASGEHPIALIANGGYGRGVLNPGSDIDLLFLYPDGKRKIPPAAAEMVEQILLMLFDCNFKVGHAVRSVKETLQFANNDHLTKTALLDSRFITGNKALYDDFVARFRPTCIVGSEDAYLRERSRDIRKRHAKHSNTVFLQEPNVKESCGGLREYHNLMWTIIVRRNETTLDGLQKDKLLTKTARKQIEAAYEFLMRVRNDLHYSQKQAGDILTLRLQGVVATNLGYPHKSILRRCEEFMRDYYRHTRNLFNRSTSLMQRFEIELEQDKSMPSKLLSFLSKSDKIERFDGFHSKGGLIYPDNKNVFADDPGRLMRLFHHTQRRGLELSPTIRNIIKRNRDLMTKAFRYNKKNRETFEQILMQRGDVARVLRQMHHVGFLGRYLPEFGALTDLVQHEFFHLFTADEHTLRCIDQLDALAHSEDPKAGFMQKLFREIDDPYIIYLALILHDTGRAKNQRTHADASATLASNVCHRLQIKGERRKRLVFLVDHHLTFWRTATTMNIDDPATIAQFAGAVRNRSYMETLLLFSYVDSKGTSAESWNDWKASLMMQLYRSTLKFFEDQEGFTAKLKRPAEELQKEVRSKLPENYAQEVNAHFRAMPERYFRFRGAGSVVRHVKLFHEFFESVAADPRGSLTPRLTWEQRPNEGFSLLEVSSWNRGHLLSRVAGALSSRRINILSADLFLRADDLVLDIFRVCTTRFEPVTSKSDKKAVEKLLATTDQTDFHELIAKARSSSIFDVEIDNSVGMPQRVYVSNHLNPDYTVLEIQARDRLALLYDIFSAISELGVDIVHARISTQQGAAIDSIYVTDEFGKKISNPAHLAHLEKAVAEAVGI